MNVVKMIVSVLCLVASLVGCATAPHNPLDTPEKKDAPLSPEKRAAAERLLQKEIFVLESGPNASIRHTITFNPKKMEMRINIGNRCYPEPVFALFWVVWEAGNVSALTKSDKADCPELWFIVDPITGVAGGYSKKDGKWSTESARYYLKRDAATEMSAPPSPIQSN